MKRMSSLLLLFRRVCINVFHLLMLMHAKENLGISVQGHQAQGGVWCDKQNIKSLVNAPHGLCLCCGSLSPSSCWALEFKNVSMCLFPDFWGEVFILSNASSCPFGSDVFCMLAFKVLISHVVIHQWVSSFIIHVVDNGFHS